MRWAVVFLCLILCFASTPSAAAGRALIILKSADLTEMQATIASLEALGAHVGHVIPPRTLIADVPTQVESQVAALPDVAELHRGAVPAAQGDAAVGVAVWNSLLAPQQSVVNGGNAKPLTGDAFEAPMEARVSVYGSNAPGTYQTSSFMVGKVAVGVVLPESSGGTEDWTPERQSDVLSRIVSGLDWWVQKGGSAAHLTFYYEPRFGVPTQYEPIAMQGAADEETWVSDIFRGMGYTSGFTRFDRARAYDAYLRRTYHTDWAFALIVVDSLNDADGQFADGHFAWAYVMGPYAVMTYDNDGYSISRMSVVATHETGHVFGAAARSSSACLMIV